MLSDGCGGTTIVRPPEIIWRTLEVFKVSRALLRLLWCPARRPRLEAARSVQAASDY
jgi:hypothetical protein